MTPTRAGRGTDVSSERSEVTQTSNRDWPLFLRRVVRGRCPRCGDGALFRSRFRLAETCDVCALRYRRESGAMTGQMYLSAAITEIVAAVFVLGVFFLTDWSAGFSIAVGLPLIVLFSYWFLPKSMGIWVAIEFMTDVGNREPWVNREP